MTETSPRPTDVDSFLDGLKFNRFHLVILILCTILTAIDGYELYVVGWVLPDLAEDFGVPRTAITSAMVAQQMGMLVGAFIVPPLADRIGRPRLLLICFAGMMLSALAILTTQSLLPFTICRFVAGLCGTAMVPILVTLASETAPRRLRSTMATITVSGTMIGAMIGALMQGFILEPFGWHGAFWIAVVLPAMMLPFIWFMPESLRAMAARKPDDPAIQILARRMQPRGADPVTIIAAPRTETATQALLSDVFGRGQRMKTFLMWAISISSFVFITAGVWKTTIFKDVIGLPWSEVALINGTNTAAGFVGMLCIGFFIDKLGFKRVMVSSFLLAALGCVLIGLLAPGPGMFLAVVMMALFQHGGQAGIAALAASLYSPRSRATGVGWTYGAGRVASIFAPLFGTFVLSEGMGPVGIFALLAVPLASAGLFTLWLMSLKGAPRITRPAHGHG
ncbi:MFS transporter [Hephaestia sp. GCM10023244]|uniref:MFS transporter n=1 Tax=unclassified Hephaestia TaxID=2631281 RepID=UPI002076E81C|nr:MFS transporter [Hephaestia sp. MAHUQ-44]MCM8732256.1 MFS transporter [Hephaestia sp. MAHUQ-44]